MDLVNVRGDTKLPIYEFACTITGEVKGEIMPLSDWNKAEIDCPIHPSTNKHLRVHKAERIVSTINHPSHAKPTIIFKNPKTGETEVALYENQQVPHGFIKEELKTPHERSRFEKEEAIKQQAENDYKTEERRFAVDFARKKRHDDLNAKMSSIVSKSENPAAAESLLKAAMERTRKKTVPKKKTNYHLAVNHKDSSNIDKG